MGRFLRQSIVTALRPPLILFGRCLGPIYRLAFGRRDIKAAQARERELAVLVTAEFEFLFTERCARITGRDLTLTFPPPFDYATVIAVDDKLAYRFTEGRDEQTTAIRAAWKQGPWNELSLVLSLLPDSEEVRRGSSPDFRHAAEMLRKNIGALDEAFAQDKFRELEAKINQERERDRVIIKQIENELNRRLYG